MQNNYSESSDSSRSSPVMSQNLYDYQSIQMRCGFGDDVCMSDEQMDEECAASAPPTVNRGGRKQVKVGTTKRNARERNRVRYINNCFEVLREHIPFELVDEEKNRKLSKVETLKYAAIYIKQLTELLRCAESSGENNCQEIESKMRKCREPFAPKLENIDFKMSSSPNTAISFNNININIYDNRVLTPHDSYSPVYSSTSPCSSTTSSASYEYNRINYCHEQAGIIPLANHYNRHQFNYNNW